MPCYDGREEQDRKDRQRRLDSLTALLCGVLNEDKAALAAAAAWKPHHDEADRRRANVEHDFQDREIHKCLEACDRVLDEFHKTLT